MAEQERWWWIVEEVDQVEKYICLQSDTEYVLAPRFNHEGDFWITVSEENAERITSIPAIEAQNTALAARVAELAGLLAEVKPVVGWGHLDPSVYDRVCAALAQGENDG